MRSETLRRYQRLALMHDAGRPLPGAREPMPDAALRRLHRAVLAEVLDWPAGAAIRALCQRLVHEEAPADE